MYYRSLARTYGFVAVANALYFYVRYPLLGYQWMLVSFAVVAVVGYFCMRRLEKKPIRWREIGIFAIAVLQFGVVFGVLLWPNHPVTEHLIGFWWPRWVALAAFSLLVKVAIAGFVATYGYDWKLVLLRWSLIYEAATFPLVTVAVMEWLFTIGEIGWAFRLEGAHQVIYNVCILLVLGYTLWEFSKRHEPILG